MTLREEIVLELIKFGLTLATLAVGWYFGLRIVTEWDIRKKRQELDIAAAEAFHGLYGEFREIARLWRTYKYEGNPDTRVRFPADLRFDLVRRAAAAEGRVEALIVRLATGRVLDRDAVRTLGLFRQAYQQLREAIRDDKRFDWTRPTREYALYNELTSRVAHLIDETLPVRQEDAKEAARALGLIAAVEPADWQRELTRAGEAAHPAPTHG